MTAHKTYNLHFACLCLATLFFSLSLQAQEDIKGLWLVEKVVVGDKEMTPVARWFNFDDNGSFQSGNGWLQNSSGVYEWDQKERSLTVYDSLNIADTYGPFKTSIKGNSMRWSRIEDGMEVVVMANRSSDGTKPMAPQDLLVGMWEFKNLTVYESNTVSEEIASEVPDHIFFKWDRKLLWYSNDERKSGIWNFNAHEPVLLTIVNDERRYWKVDVNRKQLLLILRDDNIEQAAIMYSRINHFPNR